MIARLLNEGQYRIDEDVHRELDALDERASQALEAGDETELDARLEDMWRLVRERGERLPDDDLSSSELIIPPADLTLEETRALFSEQGLIRTCPPRNPGRASSDRRVVEAEPARQVLLDRELALELRLELELAGVVALVLTGRNEGVERATLVGIEHVHGALVAAGLEAEDGSQELGAEPAGDQVRGDEVDGRHQVLDVRVANHDPLEAELVHVVLHLGPRVARCDVEQLGELSLGSLELTRGQALEADRGRAGAAQAQLDLERHLGGGEREQPVRRRLLQLFAPEERIAEAHAPLDRPTHLTGHLGEAREALLHRRMREEQLAERGLDVRRDDEEGVHRLDLAQVALRIWAIVPVIFCSALIRCSGAPVISAAPRSAVYSR